MTKPTRQDIIDNSSIYASSKPLTPESQVRPEILKVLQALYGDYVHGAGTIEINTHGGNSTYTLSSKGKSEPFETELLRELVKRGLVVTQNGFTYVMSRLGFALLGSNMEVLDPDFTLQPPYTIVDWLDDIEKKS